ncbi:hsp70-like protein [Aphanomyces invadans]|uniref:Hsp70-like protein n=1 Tax=Aphanomyces invadans TaxID=157072 RepID=A0A024UIQ6_9STRA|nr:hsp70-like protein [Aphanomyces invadans]ETW06321.1 hsp70-like protein [Aphanomyces invadans]|eukprot:XP_008864396.1 hsp70-like protein [Aphanomyces invadans]
MQKLYAAGGAPGGPGGMPDFGASGAPPPASSAQGPKIEEVD